MYHPRSDAYHYQPQQGQHEDDDNFNGGRQPVYANAPPKPKRLNSSRERESPSPERLVYQVRDYYVALFLSFYLHEQAKQASG